MSDEIDLQDLLEVQAHFRLPSPALVEKDFYVVKALAAIAAVEAPPLHVVFGGGTALSRAHLLIERMSEDIDLKIVADEEPSRRALRQLREMMTDALLNVGFRFDPDNPAHRRSGNESRYTIYRLPYEPLARGEGSLRPEIQIEVAVWPLRRPAVELPVSSFVAEAFKRPPEVANIACVSITQTAAEKFVASPGSLLGPSRLDALPSTGVEDGLGQFPYWADDPGHPQDIVRVVETFAHARWQNSADAILRAAADAISCSDLREWYRNRFFDQHIKTYSKSRRKAPIYWQLSTPSRAYSTWLLYPHLTGDSLHKLAADIVAPKLEHEERKLNQLMATATTSTAAQRKSLAVQEALVVEIRAFLEEVMRVAPLWNVNLNDGVIINFAPLWRLVPHHKSWQRELKATWDELCAGEYDWAHLAMHLWPERVVPKCVTDRSLAIAHGLEDVFWLEGSDGKWKSRPQPTRSIEDLVHERTSPAVKAALKSLTEAPVARLGGSGRRPRSSTANLSNEQI